MRDLERWAHWAAVSARCLSPRFVQETGFNFTAWRQRARMVRSLEMLAAEAPVATGALDLGYSTAFGETPSADRAQLSKPT